MITGFRDIQKIFREAIAQPFDSAIYKFRQSSHRERLLIQPKNYSKLKRGIASDKRYPELLIFFLNVSTERETSAQMIYLARQWPT